MEILSEILEELERLPADPFTHKTIDIIEQAKIRKIAISEDTAKDIKTSFSIYRSSFYVYRALESFAQNIDKVNSILKENVLESGQDIQLMNLENKYKQIVAESLMGLLAHCLTVLGAELDDNPAVSMGTLIQSERDSRIRADKAKDSLYL